MEEFVDIIEKRLDAHVEDIQAVKALLKNGDNINIQVQNVIIELTDTKRKLVSGPTKNA